MFLHLGIRLRRGKGRNTWTNEKKINQGWFFLSVSPRPSGFCSSKHGNCFPPGTGNLFASCCRPQHASQMGSRWTASFGLLKSGASGPQDLDRHVWNVIKAGAAQTGVGAGALTAPYSLRVFIFSRKALPALRKLKTALSQPSVHPSPPKIRHKGFTWTSSHSNRNTLVFQ